MVKYSCGKEKLNNKKLIIDNEDVNFNTYTMQSQPTDYYMYNDLLEKILLGKKIETTNLYDILCKINKFEHSSGIYYTSTLFFKDILIKIKISNINNTTKTLDFCCGTGNLFISYLDILKLNYNEIIIKNIIVNSTFIDIDEEAITIFKLKLYCWIINNLSIDINISEYINNFYINDGLIEIDLISNKFNVILSNPPFINLKTKVEYKKKLKELKYYEYSVSGMMDTYLLSIERIIKMLDIDAQCIIICPSQILTNTTCLKIRQYIIDNLSLTNVFNFAEKNKIFINVTQNICVLDITNNTKNKFVNYLICDYNDGINTVKNTCVIDNNIYKKNEYNIIYMTELDKKFVNTVLRLNKLHTYKTSIQCRRGNIDVTLNNKDIISSKTYYPLVRGRNMHTLNIIDEYISEETIKEKHIDIVNDKLVCQQISNIASSNRLCFKLLGSNYVISNSCNYITVTDKKYITVVNHILNSSVLNRYFVIFSGNNHISINEINNFPFPNIFNTDIDFDGYSAEEIDIKICKMYNLDDAFIKEYFCLPVNNNDTIITIYNHLSQAMSELEESMSKHIHPGGNWKDIPLSINASKRLNTIRKTGGRTTLYGRLDYNKPGFTITAQFARLPNSSNLHPKNERMITIREAGIIQSFPLEFKFSNNKSVAITQIGNAVPPILARYIANFIKNDVINKNTLDLFSGVGGMSIGFSQEGFKIVVSNELDARLVNENENLKYHNNTKFVCGDICDINIKTEILNKLDGIDIGLIIGGPPCQGFSLAGKRNITDTRNKLYLEYFDMIKTYNPECFVMENVKGILSMKNEKNQFVIDEIKLIISNLGYKISIFKLNACDFGVPQKRERVFIIGHKNKQYDCPKPIIKKDKYVTIKDAIHFLEKYDEQSECKINYKELNNNYLKYLAGSISFQELYKSYS
jgi:DNA (cytosine-5)-methyltransferase 1